MSRWLYPFERRIARARLRREAIAFLVVFLLASIADRWLHHVLSVPGERLAELEGRDWYRALRVAGTLWVWAPLCAALWLGAATRRGRENAARVFIAAVAAGLAAEVLQVLTGRLRPNHTDGAHEFRGLLERFRDTSDLEFPSSHGAVAFGGACMVALLWPRAGWVAVLMAAGCAWTRLLAGAHFASSVLAAAALGYAVARLMRPGGWWGEREGLLLP